MQQVVTVQGRAVRYARAVGTYTTHVRQRGATAKPFPERLADAGDCSTTLKRAVNIRNAVHVAYDVHDLARADLAFQEFPGFSSVTVAEQLAKSCRIVDIGYAEQIYRGDYVPYVRIGCR